MSKIILDEIKHIIRKKRFIILAALLFLGMIVWAVLIKMDFLNDYMYTIKMQKFLRVFFNPATGLILLFAQYRRRFTKTLVAETEERNVGSTKLVIGKWCAGVILLFAFYLVAYLLILLMSLILGAHCAGDQIRALTLSTFFGWILAVGSYGIALIFLFLIPFFLPAWIFYGFFAGVAPIILFNLDIPGYPLIKLLNKFLISAYTDAGYTAGVLGQTRWGYLLVLLIYTAICFGLSILFFHLKKRRIQRKAQLALLQSEEISSQSMESEDAARQTNE